MTREEAIREYAGPLDATEKAWFAWQGHLAQLHREGRITFEQAVGEWNPPVELQANEERMAALADVRKGRAELRRKGRRAEARREARSEERIERMRRRGGRE